MLGINLSANVVKTSAIKKDWNELKKSQNEIIVDFTKTEFQAQRIRLDEFGIKYKLCEVPLSSSTELRSSYVMQGRGPKYIIATK